MQGHPVHPPGMLRGGQWRPTQRGEGICATLPGPEWNLLDPPHRVPTPSPCSLLSVFSGCPTPVAVSSSISSLNLPSAHPPGPPASPAQLFLPIPPHSPSSLPDASPHYLMPRMWKKIAVTSSPDFLHSISACLPLRGPMLARSIRPELALCHCVTQARTTGSLFPCKLKIKRLSKASEALQRPVLAFYLFLSCPPPDTFTPAGKIAPCGPSITMNVNTTNPLCTSPKVPQSSPDMGPSPPASDNRVQSPSSRPKLHLADLSRGVLFSSFKAAGRGSG